MQTPNISLGLGPSPRPVFLYVSTEHNPVGWHEWNHAAKEPILVADNALTGFIKTVEIVERERRGEGTAKLNIHVACGPRNYVVESGPTTHFSRSVLSALVRLGPDHFSYPLTITVEPGTREDTVVFGNVFNATNGKPVRGSDQAREQEPADLVRRIQAAIEECHRPATSDAA